MPDVPDPELNSTVQMVEGLESWAQRTFADEPFTKFVILVAAGAALFYKAEVGKNPKVKDYWDALVYMSTCASVGYGDIFAHTPAGKALGSFMMTVGPSMANAAFVGGFVARQSERDENQRTQQEILTTMKLILAELQRQNEGTGGQLPTP